MTFLLWNCAEMGVSSIIHVMAISSHWIASSQQKKLAAKIYNGCKALGEVPKGCHKCYTILGKLKKNQRKCWKRNQSVLRWNYTVNSLF